MTIQEINAFFNRQREFHDGALNSDLVTNKRASRKDLHAMCLLDSLIPSSDFDESVVTNSQRDQFWVFPDIHELAPLLTEELCTELLRCGVQYEQGEGFCFFT